MGGVPVVASADAVVEPFAVMVEAGHAAVAFPAVFGRSEGVALT